MKRILTAAVLLAALLQSCCKEEDKTAALNQKAAAEYLTPIRPASEGRNPCWNEFSKKFTYAPAFDFAEVEGAAAYLFTVTSDKGEWSFKAQKPNADLSPVWNDIIPSQVHLRVDAVDADGKLIAEAGSRDFLRDFPFQGPYNSNVRPYREAAIMAALYVHRMKAVQSWKESTEPDMSYDHFTYANKIIGGTVSVEAKVAALVPSLREEALQIARNAAQFLMDQSRPEGDPLAFFPPTYYLSLVSSGREDNQGKTMTMDATMAGNGFLDLYDVTGEEIYLDRAIKIADTYVRLQNEDGSFPIKVDFVTGEPVNSAKAMLHPILNYARRLEKQYGITRYADMMKKGSDWMNTVAVETFDLTGQFEDVSVLGLKAYQNLTNCTAAPYASFLLTSANPSESEVRDAIDLIRMSEDQFVHWDALPTAEGYRDIPTPCVYEQHKYQMPVDNSSCNVANAWLDLYEYNGDELAYAKAKALIDNLTVIQNTCNGQIPTILRLMPPERHRSFWINCTNSSIKALLRMSELTEE